LEGIAEREEIRFKKRAREVHDSCEADLLTSAAMMNIKERDKSFRSIDELNNEL